VKGTKGSQLSEEKSDFKKEGEGGAADQCLGYNRTKIKERLDTLSR